MSDCGVADQTPEQKQRFIRLARELDSYRREDTATFITGLQSSANAWLKSRKRHQPWQPAIGVGDQASEVDQGRRQLWPRTSVFWGAILDETDRRELASTHHSR